MPLLVAYFDGISIKFFIDDWGKLERKERTNKNKNVS
jgi:hypothetical protein